MPSRAKLASCRTVTRAGQPDCCIRGCDCGADTTLRITNSHAAGARTLHVCQRCALLLIERRADANRVHWRAHRQEV